MLGTDALDLVAVVVEQLHLDQRRRLTARARLAHLIFRSQNAIDAEFGTAVDLPQRVFGKVREVHLLEREAPRRGIGDHALHRADVVLHFHVVGQVADHADRGWRAERGRDPIGLNQPQPIDGLELALQHHGLPERQRDAHEPAGPRVVQRTSRDVHVVGAVPDVRDHGPTLSCAGVAMSQGALRLARGATGVDHGGPGLGGCRNARLGFGRLGHEHVDVGHAFWHLTVEDEVCLDLGKLGLDALEHRGKLGVDIHQSGIAVIGDVGGFLVAQPIVQRHGSNTQLAGRVHHHGQPD